MQPLSALRLARCHALPRRTLVCSVVVLRLVDHLVRQGRSSRHPAPQGLVLPRVLGPAERYDLVELARLLGLAPASHDQPASERQMPLPRRPLRGVPISACLAFLTTRVSTRPVFSLTWPCLLPRLTSCHPWRAGAAWTACAAGAPDRSGACPAGVSRPPSDRPPSAPGRLARRRLVLAQVVLAPLCVRAFGVFAVRPARSHETHY